MRTDAIERVVQAIAQIQAGKMVVLVDDEDRENEGDLCMAAECVTAEAINFMARHGRGLICLTLTPERVRQLDLPMMVDDNRSSKGTAFTISIEAREGVSTGISASDRAHTVRTAVRKEASARDVVSPGHVFPLRARPGGVLQRTGHTEGSVDLARLSGFTPAGVICEIMNEDGSMARMPDLRTFADEHGLHVVSIADLVEYRMRTERIVRCTVRQELTLWSGKHWQAHLYETTVDPEQVLALTFGELSQEPTLVRMHTSSFVGDVLGVPFPNRTSVREAIETIERAGRGVVVFFQGFERWQHELQFRGEHHPPASKDMGSALREVGLGAQVLRDLGLERIRILTQRPRKIIGLEGYGLEVVDHVTVSNLHTDPVVGLN